MSKGRIITISGSRSITEYKTTADCIIDGLLHFRLKIRDIALVQEGGALGVDRAARNWALMNGIDVETVNADWDDLSVANARIKRNAAGKKYNANAGHARNKKMADNSDFVICVWDGQSPGTKQMFNYCAGVNIPVVLYEGY